ncbi:hypothetical protein BD769DRAFT_1333064, partial [Suillus cothurnatus]
LSILPMDAFIASALVHQRVIPCSPMTPTTGITVQVVEFYCVARQCNPHFSIQAYVKTMCDLQGVAFCTYLSWQFSIVYDMYLQILTNVNILVHTAIRRSDLDWRLKHTCLACMYTLTSEVPLKFRMLYMKDGNDSLKHVLKQCIGDNDLDSDDPIPSAQCSSELPTTQFVGGDWYLSREYIDQF